jgi:tetratricopeptide (TPR) repeat protein
VGVVLNPGDAKIAHSPLRSFIAARRGDLLYTGDRIQTQREQARILHCPQRAALTIAVSQEVKLEERSIVPAASLSSKVVVQECALPVVPPLLENTPAYHGRTTGIEQTTPVPPTLENVQVGEDPVAVLARVARLEASELRQQAAAELRTLRALWPEAEWIRSRILEHEEMPKATAEGTGTVHAIVIGISEYGARGVQPLRFAHRDAAQFVAYLKSARGGSVQDQNIRHLTDSSATTANIRDAFAEVLEKAGKTDTVAVLVGAHGIADPNGAFIVTYDADPQMLGQTALDMGEFRQMIEANLSRAKEVRAFVDVCRAGFVAAFGGPNRVNSFLTEGLQKTQGRLFGFAASRALESSFEGEQYGGGHGAFTFHLLTGLNGAADTNADGIVNTNELIRHVKEQVEASTNDRQHPDDFGYFDNQQILATLKDTGIQLAGAGGSPASGLLARGGQATGAASADVAEFDKLLREERLLPDTPPHAFAVLNRLRRTLPGAQYSSHVNRLRVALEDRGQQVLLKYLSGEEFAQAREDFSRGAAYFAAAQMLAPESAWLEARRRFCVGRGLLFDSRYGEAIKELEASIRLDARGAYTFNALGVAYLEQADYVGAIAAFEDARTIAPHWAYPLHNLALAYMQLGRYDPAIEAYRDAMRIAPHYAYLPYSLGLLYQTINRPRDAERMYREAIRLGVNRPAPYNALGSLKAWEGRKKEAEKWFRAAIERDPHHLAARQNLGVLLARDRKRNAEAVEMWRANVAHDPRYVPSLLSLAEAGVRAGDTRQAIALYLRVIDVQPHYVAARRALSDLLQGAGDYDQAIEQLQQALFRQPHNFELHERIADAEVLRGRSAAALAGYAEALKRVPDSQARKRIERKVRLVRQQ